MSDNFGLSPALVQSLVQTLDEANTLGFYLVGSYARGSATPHSDIDLLRYVYRLPAGDGEDDLRLEMHDGYVVSIRTVTPEQQRQHLTHPEKALWVVPALREGHILLDKEGALAALREAAQAWQPDRGMAARHASYLLFLQTETVHKMLAAFERQDESALVMHTLQLTLAMTRALAVYHQVFIPSEAQLFPAVQKIAGEKSDWSRRLLVAAGVKTGDYNGSPLMARASGALALYQETVTLLQPVIQAEHSGMIQDAWQAIADSDL